MQAVEWTSFVWTPYGLCFLENPSRHMDPQRTRPVGYKAQLNGGMAPMVGRKG